MLNTTNDISTASILGQVALGYAPFIDRQFAIFATRLTVFPLRAEPDLAIDRLLQEVGNVWPANAGRVSLNIAGEKPLRDLLTTRPPANLMIEVPAFMAADPAHAEALSGLRANGNTLLLKGRPLADLPRAVLPCFEYAIVDRIEDRRTPDFDGTPLELRSLPYVQAGVSTLGEMEEAFARGADFVLGWPIGGTPAPSTKARPRSANLQSIVELISLVDREASIDAIEPLLKRDPTLAFKLLRYINSPAFGLRVEISSFRHAVMILGYQPLKRWLALLLATAGDDGRIRPAMFAAVRRGLFFEELVRDGGDSELRSELFIFGVFSLLDRMFDQPFTTLLESIRVPERVREALGEDRGPFIPYLELMQAIEGGALIDLREAADKLMLSLGQINRAQLRALTTAAELE